MPKLLKISAYELVLLLLQPGAPSLLRLGGKGRRPRISACASSGSRATYSSSSTTASWYGTTSLTVLLAKGRGSPLKISVALV